MRIIRISIGVLFLLIAALAVRQALNRSGSLTGPTLPKTVTSLGDADYSWNMKTLDGRDFSLTDAKGKVLILNEWATWCGPCRMEMPSLQKLYDKVGNDAVFVLVSDERTETVKKFVEANHYTLPIYISDDQPKAYDTEGIPATFVISPDGKIVLRELGASDWNSRPVVSFLKNLNRH